MFKIKQVTCDFAPIWRIFISGSSSAGKTYFARNLLETNIFDAKRIYYYHPDIDEDNPTDWGNHLSQPVIFQVGLPSSQDLFDLPENSCVVLDDLFREAASSRNIDYLFRVLSGKKKLHVIIMTQRYFEGGPFALSIRNSSNYHVLMNNSDFRINERASNRLGLKSDFLLAKKDNSTKLYPYVFIDQTNQARVSGLQVYTDILSKHKKVITNSMICYLISEREFKSNFKVVDNHTAKNGDDTTKALPRDESGFSKPSSNKRTSDTRQSSYKIKNEYSKPNTTCQEPSKKSGEKQGRGQFNKYLEKRRIARSVREALQKHRFST